MKKVKFATNLMTEYLRKINELAQKGKKLNLGRDEWRDCTYDSSSEYNHTRTELGKEVYEFTKTFLDKNSKELSSADKGDIFIQYLRYWEEYKCELHINDLPEIAKDYENHFGENNRYYRTAKPMITKLNLKGAILSQYFKTDLDFLSVDLSGVTAPKNFEIPYTKFINCDLSNSLVESNFNQCKFINSNLDNANFSTAGLCEAKFTECSISNFKYRKYDSMVTSPYFRKCEKDPKQNSKESTQPFFTHKIEEKINTVQTEPSIQLKDDKLTIVLDIDGVLTAHEANLDNDSRRYVYRKGSLLIAENAEHQIFPGIIELLQYLYSKKDIQIAFYSAGKESRNKKFVYDLLLKAIGSERFKEIEKSLMILSGNHLVNGKKDLRKVLGSDASLMKIMLVDDQAKSVHPDQQRNYLYAGVGSVEYKEYFTGNELNSPEENKTLEQENFIRFNLAFYLAGAISEQIIKNEQKSDFEIDLSDYQDTRSQSFFEFDTIQNMAYFKKGLEILRKFNPELSFVTEHDYMQVLKNPMTEQEKMELDDIASKATRKQDDCLVM